jgi:outer membrane protein TolC
MKRSISLATRVWTTMQVLKGAVPDLVLIGLWTVIFLGGFFLAPAGATNPATGKAVPEISPTEPLDFDTCARLAIRQSPFLTKSNLEIQIRHLDEKDSKADFLPSFNFQTRYYPTTISQGGVTSNQYYLNFVSEPYSPVIAYFSLQVRKIITRLAIQNHLKAISEGLHRLGRMFLELDSLTQLAQIQTELIQAAGKNLDFMQEQLKIGQGNALELKVASQELEMARIQHRKLLEGQRKIKEGVRSFLALPADRELRFDLPKSRSQILGNFAAGTDPAEAFKNSSFDYKIQVLKSELQKYKITLAKTKLLPTLLMGAQTPDPLTLVQSKSMFFFLGANIPVWDGFKRLRDVNRQKIALKQSDAETTEKEIDYKEKWQAAQDNLNDAASELEISQSQLELAVLKAKQQEVRYHTLGEPFPVYLEGEKGVSQARKNIVMKTLDYDQAKLNLRNLANDLVSTYVNENSLPQREEK